MRKIAFVCFEPWISGGFNVIFRHAMELARGGITVAIVCKTPVTAEHIGWHPIAEMADHPNLLWLDYNEALSHRFDLAIATWWRTFFDLWKVQADRYAEHPDGGDAPRYRFLTSVGGHSLYCPRWRVSVTAGALNRRF